MVTSRRLGVERALVAGQWVIGDVSVDGDGRIDAVGLAGTSGRGCAVPGFVDLQVNGFAGVEFGSAGPDALRHAQRAMARTGVTSYLPTVPTRAFDDYARVLDSLAVVIAEPAADGSRALGVHLEGPFLCRPGAHDPGLFLDPTPERMAELLGRAPVAMMTMAPERPGALASTAWLCERGVVVSAGHSDADGSEAHRAFDAGMRATTHLWNAQSPMTSRAPGLAGVALARPDVFVGIIADLIHVSAETLAVSFAAAGGRAFIVTDGSTFSGLDPADISSTGRIRRQADGSVRMADGTLAGSSTTIDQEVRNLVSLGVPLADAVGAATRVPARVLDRSDIGDIAPGGRADVVVLDDGLEVETVLLGGRAV